VPLCIFHREVEVGHPRRAAKTVDVVDASANCSMTEPFDVGLRSDR
jgi:hypothetical protein